MLVKGATGGGGKYIKGPYHMAEGGHHPRKAPQLPSTQISVNFQPKCHDFHPRNCVLKIQGFFSVMRDVKECLALTHWTLGDVAAVLNL